MCVCVNFKDFSVCLFFVKSINSAVSTFQTTEDFLVLVDLASPEPEPNQEKQRWVYTPLIWNEPPENYKNAETLSSFKSGLKTH